VKLIPAQKSCFKLPVNKQSQWITITSVNPELCKVLSKLGRQQIPAPIHPAPCIDDHTTRPQQLLQKFLSRTWWNLSTLGPQNFICVRSQQESESPQETLQLDQKVLFCPAVVVRPLSWSCLYMGGYHMQSTILEKGFSWRRANARTSLSLWPQE